MAVITVSSGINCVFSLGICGVEWGVLWSQGRLWLAVVAPPPPPPPLAGTSLASLYLPAAPQDLGYILTQHITLYQHHTLLLIQPHHHHRCFSDGICQLGFEVHELILILNTELFVCWSLTLIRLFIGLLQIYRTDANQHYLLVG